MTAASTSPGSTAGTPLLDEPEVYGLPPDPVVTTRDIVSIWKHVTGAAIGLAALGVASFVGRRR